MADLSDLQLKVKNYKCFGGNEAQGFSDIRPINLIIGRNNSGKSSLLEVVENAIDYNDEIVSLSPNDTPPKIIISTPLTDVDLKKTFRPGQSSADIHGGDDFKDFGKYLVGQTIVYSHGPKAEYQCLDISVPETFRHDIPANHSNGLSRQIISGFSGKNFKRLYAERDIKPEGDKAGDLSIGGDGSGITNVINNIINSETLPSELAEIKFLAELNKIMVPDAEFSRILVQKRQNSAWEVELQQIGRDPISLTHSGSGLQTIILVLGFIHLVPFLENKELSTYIFAFEELENNLHPSLLRRLFSYIRDIAVKHGCHFFMTTHSNVAIDLFSNDELATIVHVTHDGQDATARTIDTYVGRREILADLDFRASDLLQSNGIVWVEGPTDRIYFNRWVELMSDVELVEGRHYQCVFYGGRLLSHLSADDPDEDLSNLIKILQVNRNAILIMDSDKKTANDKINPTKRRIKGALAKFGGLPWVTMGREIENYIPRQALENLYEKKVKATLATTHKITGYLDKFKRGEGKRYESNKVQFALKVCPHITVEGINDTHDLKAMIQKSIRQIKKWNQL